jgi:hypothetical protein
MFTVEEGNGEGQEQFAVEQQPRVKDSEDDGMLGDKIKDSDRPARLARREGKEAGWARLHRVNVRKKGCSDGGKWRKCQVGDTLQVDSLGTWYVRGEHCVHFRRGVG